MQAQPPVFMWLEVTFGRQICSLSNRASHHKLFASLYAVVRLMLYLPDTRGDEKMLEAFKKAGLPQLD